MSPIASVGGGGGGGALSQIADVLLAAPAATIDITAIPGTFNHLVLVTFTRTAIAGTQEGLVCRFNNDATANYYFDRVKGSGTGASADEGVATGSAELGVAAGNTAPANHFAGACCVIPNYAKTTGSKSIVHMSISALAFSATNIIPRIGGILWDNTAAINRITLLGSAGNNFVTGSRAVLYGLT